MKSSSNKNLLKKILATLLLVLISIAVVVFLVFHYDEIGYFFTIVIIISLVILLLPKFLRKNFDTNNEKFLNFANRGDFDIKTGSFIWTKSEANGLFPYRKIFLFKTAEKQLEGKVYYIEGGIKLIIVLVQIVHLIVFPFIFVELNEVKDPLKGLLATIIVGILFLYSLCNTRNFIIEKFAKNLK